jgi:hypothetical protein
LKRSAEERRSQALLGHWLFGLPGLFGASALSNVGVGAIAYRWLGSQICASKPAATRPSA